MGLNDAKVLILMGSDSDLPVMAEAAKILGKLEVPYELYVSSAHRCPDRTARIIREAEEAGVGVFISGAGSAAHRSATAVILNLTPHVPSEHAA